MNKLQKARLLFDLQEGKISYKDMAPKIEFLFIEVENGCWADITNGGITEHIMVNDLEQYITKKKEKFSNHLIQVTQMPYNEYKQADSILEKMY